MKEQWANKVAIKTTQEIKHEGLLHLKLFDFVLTGSYPPPLHIS